MQISDKLIFDQQLQSLVKIAVAVGKNMQANKYLIAETTKEERIALIKSWIPEDEVMDGCDIDLWEMYADYITGVKEIAECNAAFQAEYYAG